MSTGTAMLERSEFKVPKMDCPSEEQAVRLALKDMAEVRKIAFDLPNRQLVVWHAVGVARQVGQRLEPLGFGATLVGTHPAEKVESEPAVGEAAQASTLRILLAINAVMFVVEVVAGWLVQSTGLLADSLDMFADAAVYGLSLRAVRQDAAHRVRAARLSGVLQLVLALGAMFEVTRRFVVGSDPEPSWMLAIAALALVANVTCLVLVARHRDGGAHMKASYIFSTNDVLANIGVIVAGGLVMWTRSPYPDLVIGAIIGMLVLSGAIRILRLR